MRAHVFSTLLLVTAAIGCGASAEEALIINGVPPKKEPSEDAERYSLSAPTTQVEVDINGFVSYTLAFPDISGELLLDTTTPAESTATLVVNMKTATTDNKELERIAKSEDFLDVEKYPTATFEVRQLNKTKRSNDYKMVGLLELHGTEKALTVPFSFQVDSCRTLASTAFAINRRKFGVESDTTLDGMASDEVDIRVKINIPRDSAPQTCKKKK